MPPTFGGGPSPWLPAPTRLDPRSFAFYQRAIGRSRDEVYAELVRRYGPGSPYPQPITAQAAGTLATFADNAQGRFATFFSVAASYKLPRSLIPRNQSIGSTYQYTANVRMVNQATGQTEWRFVQIASSANLTAGDVEQQAYALASSLYGSRGPSPIPGRRNDVWQPAGVDLLYVFRQT